MGAAAFVGNMGYLLNFRVGLLARVRAFPLGYHDLEWGRGLGKNTAQLENKMKETQTGNHFTKTNISREGKGE